MSREAINHVLEHSKSEDGSRLVMLCLAHHCHKTKVPFTVKVPASQLAKETKLAARWTQEILRSLENRNELLILRHGSGRRPNVYELTPRSCVVHLVSTDQVTAYLPPEGF